MDVTTQRNESIKSFDTQEFEDLEKEFAVETLIEEKDLPVVENQNDQAASNRIEVLFV